MKRHYEKLLGNPYTHSLITAICTGVVFIVFIIACHITPFGDKTWLVYDMKRQYVDFYSYYKTLLSGKNNILYSSAIALGAGAVGFYTYYLSSPSLLLLVFFDKLHIPEAITMMIGIKIALTAGGCDLFMYHYLSRIKDGSVKGERVHTFIFAFSYAFCAFIISNSVNPMWLDVFAMMPVAIWMLDRLIYEKAKIGYILSLAFMLWCNYYITFMICFFIVIWTCYRLILEPKEFWNRLIRVGLCSFWAVCLDAVILVPTAIELLGSPKDIFVLGLETTKGNLMARDIAAKMWFLAYDRNQTISGTPLIYAGVLVVFMVFLYMMNGAVKTKEKLCMLIMGLIFWISFAFDKVNLVWHAGMEPSGYPYREAFLYVFICLLCSLRCFNRLDGIDIKRILIALAVSVAVFMYAITGKYAFVDRRYIVSNCILIVLVFIAVFVYVFFTTGGRFPRTNRTRAVGKAVIIILIAIQMSELFLDSVYIYRQLTSMNMLSKSEYEHTVSQTQEAVRVAATDKEYYHMDNMKQREQNDDMMYDYNGVTHYSSAGLLYTRYFLQKIGYNDDGLYTEYGHDNTMTADSLLAIRYIIGADGYRDGYEKLYDGEYSLHKNPYSLSVASLVDDKPELPEGNPFELQEKMYSNITGEETHIFDNAIMWKQEFSENGVGYLYCMCKTVKDGYVYMYIDDIEDYTQNLVVYVNEDAISGYGNSSSLKILNLGYHSAGDVFDVYVKPDCEDAHLGTPVIVTEDVKALKDCYELARMRDCKITKLSSSEFRIDISKDMVSENTRGVTMTIPYEKGWNVKVNGNKAEYESTYDAFIFIPLENTDSDICIEMSYIPEGMIEGIIISVIAILGIILLIIMDRRQEE
ncbi:MAG: YfhO family protein [Lachnospiraceae bacterium]|nr:YfhO family protein [Lachnospiraceae bacterium]